MFSSLVCHPAFSPLWDSGHKWQQVSPTVAIKDDGDVWQVTGTKGDLQLEFWEKMKGWDGEEWLKHSITACGCISQQSATEKHNQWQMRILHVVYVACTTSTSWKRFPWCTQMRKNMLWLTWSIWRQFSFNLCNFSTSNWWCDEVIRVKYTLVWQRVHRQPTTFERRMFEQPDITQAEYSF